MGEPTQVKERNWSAKCSLPMICAGRNSARAVPSPLVPATSSATENPQATDARSSPRSNPRSPVHRPSTRAWRSARMMLEWVSSSRSANRLRICSAARNSRLERGEKAST